MEKVCPKCAEKDKEIADLNKKIVELQFFIDDLKESQETDKKKISEICRQLEKEKDRYNQLLEEKGSNETYIKKISELSKQLEGEKGSKETYIKKISELSQQLDLEKDKYNKLKKEYDAYKASKEKITQTIKPRIFPIPNYKGCSIVDALISIGYEGSFNYRKRIADINGIGNYIGQPNQNLHMLELLNQGRLVIP